MSARTVADWPREAVLGLPAGAAPALAGWLWIGTGLEPIPHAETLDGIQLGWTEAGGWEQLAVVVGVSEDGLTFRVLCQSCTAARGLGRKGQERPVYHSHGTAGARERHPLPGRASHHPGPSYLVADLTGLLARNADRHHPATR